ncbi:ankyrin repeat domain-containing protein 36C-like isoform X2 [Physella acuta]|uniref:ankyrin repeat domain-containing protein 36C-like isoform X2 n=1 Tax=Physella acuta TaxID=109671 RepID=UPI0027DBD2E2|nr:ankyrin repeat domain-containing protein 36C-like isoform X2 [Physella acuta]
MKKLWKKLKGKDRSGEASPKSGSTRGSVASLNTNFDVNVKELGKLHKAAWTGDLNKVKQLAKKDPNPLDKEKRSPLHLACIQGYDQIVQELLEWKAKPNIGDSQSKTPLMRAVEFQREGCVDLLLDEGVDVDTTDFQGYSPLHLAVETGNLNIIKKLLSAGVSLNTLTKEGFAPLHLAVKNRQLEICTLLLNSRADVNIKDANSRTPLMIACQDGSIPLVRLLLECKADVLHKDSKGWSADDHAGIKGHHACSQLISDHLRLSYGTPASTPRSTSQPPSSLNTPRELDLMGLPVADGGGEDSDNETISKASGAPGSDSWADSPDVSIGDEIKKGKKEDDDGTDVGEEIFDEPKVSAPKISLAKFATSIHVSESDTDGESVKSSTPRRKVSVVDNPMDHLKESLHTTEAKLDNRRQISLQSQVSGEDNSWGDSPQTPRKNISAQRVSFKKDEELSEIHDITVSDSESDLPDNKNGARKLVITSTPIKPELQGYVPSASATSNPSLPSIDKMKALMEELGIGDVDDISDVSDASPPPPLPASPPPNVTHVNQKEADSDWDTSVVSDLTTPRPGILKNWSSPADSGNAGLKLKPQTSNHVLKHSAAVDSGDENSDWDSTETQNVPSHPKSPVQLKQKKDSISEWDSEIEESVHPASASLPAPPQIAPPVTAETKLKVNHNEHDDWDTTEASNHDASLPAATETNKVGSSKKKKRGGFFTFVEGKSEPREDDDDSESSWDSEADEVSDPGTVPAVYNFFQETQPVVQPKVSQTQVAAEVSKTKEDSSDEEESESISSWELERRKQKQGVVDVLAEEVDVDVMENHLVEQQLFGVQGEGEDDEEEFNRQWEEERHIQLMEEEIKREEEKRRREEMEEEMEEERRREEMEEEERRKEEMEEERRREEMEEELRRKEAERVRQEEELDRRRKEQERLWKEEQERIKLEREENERRNEELREQERIKEEREKQEKLRKEREEQEKLWKQEEERKKKEQQERMRREAEEERIRKEQEMEWIRKEEEERERQEEIERQWEIEEEEKEEKLRIDVEEVIEKQKMEKFHYSKMSSDVLEDTITRVKLQQEELIHFENDEVDFYNNEETTQENKTETIPPPVKSSSPKLGVGLNKPAASGMYAGLGSSTVVEIKQRLQVPPVSSTPPPLLSASLHPWPDPYDDNESIFSGDERGNVPTTSYYQGLLNSHSLYRPSGPLDDDALSYTSTEFEDQVHSTPSYGKDREILTNIQIGDPSSLLKVQEYVRDTRRQLEQEKNYRIVLENKLKVATKEKNELNKKLDSISQLKTNLEQEKLDLEVKIRSLEYGLADEEEKRKNAQVLLNKTKEQLSRKETQYTSELEAKQRAELAVRNLQVEYRTAAATIKDLEEEREELQRQVNHMSNARQLQEQINEDQQKFILQRQSSLENDLEESPREFSPDPGKHKAEVYALKMEMERQRSRFKDEITFLGVTNEELENKVDELRNEIKLNDEALAHATMQYNMQLSSLRADLSSAHGVLEKERATKEKLDAEIDSLKTRLVSTNQEMDKAINARNEIERDYRREKDVWAKEMERKTGEVTSLKDENQLLNQRLHATEAKFNSMENELHVSNTSLLERTAQLQQLKHEIERQKSVHDTLDQNYRHEKEQGAKLQAKVENLQERLTNQQHENLSLRQQLDTLKLSAGGSGEANEKLNSILANLRADSDRAKTSLEEKNSNLIEQVARLKEEVRGSETRKVTLEQDLRKLNEEHNAIVRKSSETEATLHITLKAKEQAEQDRARLKSEVEQLQQRYQATHDKLIESQARISELVDRLEKAEHTSLFSSQQLANTSANMHGLVKSKSQMDENIQQLQIENARLEAELKYEKQRADMLNQDLMDSQKVRSSLEALCANLKTTSAHLEDRLGSENGYEDTRLDIADLERNKNSSESKLGEESFRAKMAEEERRSLEERLEVEKEKNHQLQKDINTLKMHLKSAKTKIKDSGRLAQSDSQYADFRQEVNNKETFVSTPRQQFSSSEPQQNHSGQNIDLMRSEIEAKYRMELNRKLEDVNRFLDSQSHLRDRLDTSRTDLEANLLLDKRKLEEEINNLRIKFEQAVAQRETKEMEVKRFKELYESEMKWRMRISDQLQLATEKSFNLKSKLSNERHFRNSRLTGSIGSVVGNNSFDVTRVNGFHDDELSSKIKAELDRSIAKHLEAAPHDYKKPVMIPTKDVPLFSSTLTQSSNDYIEILKRKYCV